MFLNRSLTLSSSKSSLNSLHTDPLQSNINMINKLLHMNSSWIKAWSRGTNQEKKMFYFQASLKLFFNYEGHLKAVFPVVNWKKSVSQFTKVNSTGVYLCIFLRLIEEQVKLRFMARWKFSPLSRKLPISIKVDELFYH